MGVETATDDKPSNRPLFLDSACGVDCTLAPHSDTGCDVRRSLVDAGLIIDAYAKSIRPNERNAAIWHLIELLRDTNAAAWYSSTHFVLLALISNKTFVISMSNVSFPSMESFIQQLASTQPMMIPDFIKHNFMPLMIHQGRGGCIHRQLANATPQ